MAAATTRRCGGGNSFSERRVGKETVEVRVVGRRVSMAEAAMAGWPWVARGSGRAPRLKLRAKASPYPLEFNVKMRIRFQAP